MGMLLATLPGSGVPRRKPSSGAGVGQGQGLRLGQLQALWAPPGPRQAGPWVWSAHGVRGASGPQFRNQNGEALGPALCRPSGRGPWAWYGRWTLPRVACSPPEGELPACSSLISMSWSPAGGKATGNVGDTADQPNRADHSSHLPRTGLNQGSQPPHPCSREVGAHGLSQTLLPSTATLRGPIALGNSDDSPSLSFVSSKMERTALSLSGTPLGGTTVPGRRGEPPPRPLARTHLPWGRGRGSAAVAFVCPLAWQP